jgi:hypothetical protein
LDCKTSEATCTVQHKKYIKLRFKFLVLHDYSGHEVANIFGFDFA